MSAFISRSPQNKYAAPFRRLTPSDEGPPHAHSDPEQVIKYLARYLTGGPISDRRILAHQDGQVVFSARSKSKKAGNAPRQVTMSGIEFTRCWAMHILPKGFTDRVAMAASAVVCVAST